MELLTFVLLLLLIVSLKYHRQLTHLVTRRLHLYKCMRQLPGPPAWPLLGSAPYFKPGREDFSHQLEDWSIEYGSKEGIFKVWLGPVPVVALNKAHTVQPVFSSWQETRKPSVYDIMRAFLGDGLITSHGEKWKARRRMLTPAFHQSILIDFMQIYNEQSDILLDSQLEGLFAEGSNVSDTVDFDPIIRRCALDVICATSMGTAVGAQQQAQNHYGQCVETMNKLAFKLDQSLFGNLLQLTYMYQRSPWLWPKWLWYLSGWGRQYDDVVATVTDFTRGLIRKRRAELEQLASERGCSLAELRGERRAIPAIDILLMNNAENRLSEEDIREEIDTLASAGHETTSASICWTFFYLGHHPEYQQRLYDEIHARFGNERRDVTADDLKGMDYLDKCYREAMRLTPPVSFLGRLLTEDTHIGKYTIPAGTTVFLIPILVHLDPDQYPDPKRYDPERFSADAIAQRHSYSYIPFSAGPRNCVGQKFATMEAKTILVKVLRQYRVESMVSLERARPLPEIITKPKNGFPIRLHRRQPLK